jgi:hypothetical protein
MLSRHTRLQLLLLKHSTAQLDLAAAEVQATLM